jgi:hypothetical protein
MASTPVSAVHPEEKARSAKKTTQSPVSDSNPSVGMMSYSALSATGGDPRNVCTIPRAIIVITARPDQYPLAAAAGEDPGTVEEIYEETDEQRRAIFTKILGEMQSEEEEIPGERISMLNRISAQLKGLQKYRDDCARNRRTQRTGLQALGNRDRSIEHVGVAQTARVGKLHGWRRE